MCTLAYTTCQSAIHSCRDSHSQFQLCWLFVVMVPSINIWPAYVKLPVHPIYKASRLWRCGLAVCPCHNKRGLKHLRIAPQVTLLQILLAVLREDGLTCFLARVDRAYRS